MFNLTKEEKRVIVFLLILAISGVCLNRMAKASAKVEKFLAVPAGLAKMNINTVTLDELIDSRCISRKLAQTILDYRTLHGDFNCLEGLKDIKGIGKHRYDKLKELFYLE